MSMGKLGKFYFPFNLGRFHLGYLLDERYIKSLKDVNKIEFKPSSIQVFENFESYEDSDLLL